MGFRTDQRDKNLMRRHVTALSSTSREESFPGETRYGLTTLQDTRIITLGRPEQVEQWVIG